MLFTDLHLVWFDLRKATSGQELQEELDDILFSIMYTAYFYLSEAQEPSIGMKIVRARQERGLNTEKVKTLVTCPM